MLLAESGDVAPAALDDLRRPQLGPNPAECNSGRSHAGPESGGWSAAAVSQRSATRRGGPIGAVPPRPLSE